MIWPYILAAALGLVLGFRFKVHAIAVGSLIILLGGTPVGVAAGWTIGWAFLVAFGASFAFQGGYILGLSLLCFSRPARPHNDGPADSGGSFDDGLVETRVPGP
jgi:hypothetical protein